MNETWHKVYHDVTYWVGWGSLFGALGLLVAKAHVLATLACAITGALSNHEHRRLDRAKRQEYEQRIRFRNYHARRQLELGQMTPEQYAELTTREEGTKLPGEELATTKL
jgi:hypothetical protein